MPLLPGTRASRRSTAAILGPITVSSFTGPETCISRYPGRIGAALHPMLSKPLKAAPSSGADDDPASWDELTRLACRRRTLLRQLDVPRRRPRLSKAGAQKQRQGGVSIRHPAFARSFNI